MNARLEGLGILIYGTDLPVVQLGSALELKPLVVRGHKRKRLPDDAEAGATYCCFKLDYNTNLLPSLNHMIERYSKVIAAMAKLSQVEKLTLHAAIYVPDYVFEVFPLPLLSGLHKCGISLWLDIYYEGVEDMEAPPESVVNNGPVGTIWFGGLVDRLDINVAEYEPPYTGNAVRDLLSERFRVPCSDSPDFSSELKNALVNSPAAIQGETKQAAIWCLTESTRTNRSIEVSVDDIGYLLNHNLPLVIVSAHKTWTTQD